MTSTTAYDAKPAQCLPIGLWTRLADSWDARRNATASPPRPSPLDPSPSTLRLEAIGHHHQDAIHGELLSFLKDTAADRIMLARLRAELADAQTAHLRASGWHETAAMTPVSGETRHGEELLAPDAVARRRQAEHGRVVTAAAREASRAAAAASEVERQIAEVTQRVAERLTAAQTRSRRIHERDSARIDRYRAVLCRRHPDGVELNAVFTAAGGLRLPVWVTTSPDASALADFAWAA